MSMNNEISIEYLAGYFDGKGCITVLLNGKSKYPSLRVFVKSTDADSVKLFGAYFGRRSKDVTKAQGNQWANYKTERFSVDGQRAVRVLRELAPFLRSTHTQAQVALKTDWETSLAQATDRAQLLRSRMEAREKIALLKRRNPIKGTARDQLKRSRLNIEEKVGRVEKKHQIRNER